MDIFVSPCGEHFGQGLRHFEQGLSYLGQGLSNLGQVGWTLAISRGSGHAVSRRALCLASMSPWRATGTPFLTIFIDLGAFFVRPITQLAPNARYSSPIFGSLAPCA